MSNYSIYGGKTELDGLLWIDTADLKRLNHLKPGGISSTDLIWTDGASGSHSSASITIDLRNRIHGTATLKYKTTDRIT